MKTLNIIAKILIVVGALNWGLVGFFQFDLVQWISMGSAIFAKVVYDLVGLAAVYKILTYKKS